MQYTLRFDMGNAAFEEDPRAEAARILRREADRLEAGDYYPGHSQTVLDINGNDIGRGKVGN